MPKLEIKYLPVSSLKPRAKNPRTHTKKQINQIGDSIESFDFLTPVLIDAENHMITGHGRLEAAKLKGLSEIPTVCVEHLTEAEIRAYLIADNKIAENAGWDRDLLALELKELEIEKIEPARLGFEPAELEALAARVRGLSPSNSEAVPAVETAKPAVSRPGDLWLIGPHRLLCGDALNPNDYATLTGGEKMDCIFTDPPYNVPVKGHVSGKGKVQHREFAMASGEMSEGEFTGFLSTVFGNLACYARDGALHYICMDWRHMGPVLAAGVAASLSLQNLCVWVKSNGGMGSFYRSQHELVFVYKSGSASHINNVALGKNGRNRTNVWEYAGANAFGASRESDLSMHPTVKPVRLIADALLDCTIGSALVLDVFAGSGSTFLAADETGRCCFGLEIDPYYVDTIVRRLEQNTSHKAMLDGSGLSFEAVATARTLEGGPHA